MVNMEMAIGIMGWLTGFERSRYKLIIDFGTVKTIVAMIAMKPPPSNIPTKVARRTLTQSPFPSHSPTRMVVA